MHLRDQVHSLTFDLGFYMLAFSRAYIIPPLILLLGWAVCVHSGLPALGGCHMFTGVVCMFT